MQLPISKNATIGLMLYWVMQLPNNMNIASLVIMLALLLYRIIQLLVISFGLTQCRIM